MNRGFARVVSMSLCAAALGGCSVAERFGVASREPKQYTIEEFMDTLGVSGASFSPDGSKILVSTDATGIFNAYAYPVGGGPPEQLTHSTTDVIFAQSYFPNDERFVYTADQGGNELNHLYVRELDGRATDLTPGEKLKAQFAGWAQDDKSFFVLTNERDPKFFDLYEYQTTGYARELIYRNEEGYSVGAISPDRQTIALVKVVTNHDNNMYLHDRRTGDTKLISEHAGEAMFQPAGFSPDGAKLYYVTNDGHEFRYLAARDIATGTGDPIVRTDWDVAFAEVSKSGRYLIVGVNEDARTNLRVYERETMKPIRLPELPRGEIVSATLSRDEESLALYAGGSRSPGDLYHYSLEPRGAPTRLTSRLNPKIDPGDLVDAEVVRFKSYDGVEVPGILYKPHQASRSAKAPALVYVHGGPGGQTRAGYSAQIQYLVNHGYVVYGINNRGSSGYGKTFYAMDDKKHGEADLDDCVASKKMLVDTGYVDPERIGIMGGSYGGYMVCAALAFRPEEFDVGVNIFGVTNWVRTLKSTPAWWAAERDSLFREMGDPFKEEEYLRRISPLFHAKNIVRPLIVLQGANDPRVLKVESDEIVEAARANGVPVEYVVFDDEGHGFRKRENQIESNRAILAFLDKHLKG